MVLKNKKTSVLVLLALVLVVQVVFSGTKKSSETKTVGVDVAVESDNVTNVALDTESNKGDEGTELITEDEIVSAELNVVYRSTVTSSEAVDDFEGNIDEGGFNNKILSYTSERLQMFTEPDLTADVVGVMYSGSEASIIEIGDEWTLVASGGLQGYVRNVDVLFGNEAVAMAQAIGKADTEIIPDVANVYVEASASSDVLTTVSRGDIVDVLEQRNGFDYVLCDAGYGYIAKDELNITYGLSQAISIEEEKARQEAEAEAARRAKEEAEAAAAEAARREQEAKVDQAAAQGNRAPFNLSADDLHLLAAIVYWESGWEPAVGQLGVANVVLNRVISPQFAQNTIAGVIYAPGQFTGVTDGNGNPSERFQQILNMSNEELNVHGTYDIACQAAAGQNNVGDFLFFISAKKANLGHYAKYMIMNNHCFYNLR